MKRYSLYILIILLSSCYSTRKNDYETLKNQLVEIENGIVESKFYSGNFVNRGGNIHWYKYKAGQEIIGHYLLSMNECNVEGFSKYEHLDNFELDTLSVITAANLFCNSSISMMSIDSTGNIHVSFSGDAPTYDYAMLKSSDGRKKSLSYQHFFDDWYLVE